MGEERNYQLSIARTFDEPGESFQEEPEKISLLREKLRGLFYWIKELINDPSLPWWEVPEDFQLNYVPSSLAGEGGKIILPPLLPFLEPTYLLAVDLLQEETTNFSLSPGQRKILGGQAAEGLVRVLEFIRDLKEGKIRMREPFWERTNDNFFCFRLWVPLERGGAVSIYYTPGRGRLGFTWVEVNPHGERCLPPELAHSQAAMIAEVRLDVCGEGKDCLLEADFSVRMAGLEKRERGWTYHNNNSAVNLIDSLYGENRHHFVLGRGARDAYLSYQKSLMDSLGIGFLQKEVGDIPLPLRANKDLGKTRRV